MSTQINGRKFYSLHEACKVAQKITKGTENTLYIYAQPSSNGLFVDWILSGLRYNNIVPNVTIKNGKEE